MKIGVLGGTFDPIHLGHLIIAEEARSRLGLKKVLFVPAGDPWLKSGGRRVTGGHHRLAMVEAAIGSNPFFEASSVDLDRPGRTYTIETLRGLRLLFPPSCTFYFIIGYDGLRGITRWKEPGRLVRMCRFVACPRPGSREPDLERLEAAVPGISQKTILLNQMGPIGISSSDIRHRVAAGDSIRYLVPLEVEQYIRKHRLFRPLIYRGS